MKNFGIVVMGIFLLSCNISVSASTVSEVTTRVNKVQTDDASLPTPSIGLDKKGFVGEIIAGIFDTQGKILSSFIYALQSLTLADQNKIMKWNGSAFTPSGIIDVAGNIGIATLAPETRLHVNGVGRFDNGVQVDGINSISSDGRALTAKGNATSYGYFQVLNEAGERGAYFGYGNGTGTVDLVIDRADTLNIRSGKVGIGVVAPTENLEVSGNIKASGRVIASSPTQPEHLATKEYVDSKIITESGGVEMKYYIKSLTQNGRNKEFCPAGYSIISCDSIRQPNTFNAGWYQYVSIQSDNSCNVYGSLSYDDKMLLVCMVIPGMLVNAQHSEEDCSNVGGTVYAINSKIKICKMTASYCPAGWTQYQNWSTTINTPSPTAVAGSFLNPFLYHNTVPKCEYKNHPEGWDSITSYGPCTPANSHTFSNSSVEKCSATITGKYSWCNFNLFGCWSTGHGSGPINTLCHNARSEIGCY